MEPEIMKSKNKMDLTLKSLEDSTFLHETAVFFPLFISFLSAFLMILHVAQPQLLSIHDPFD